MNEFYLFKLFIFSFGIFFETEIEERVFSIKLFSFSFDFDVFLMSVKNGELTQFDNKFFVSFVLKEFKLIFRLFFKLSSKFLLK